MVVVQAPDFALAAVPGHTPGIVITVVSGGKFSAGATGGITGTTGRGACAGGELCPLGGTLVVVWANAAAPAKTHVRTVRIIQISPATWVSGGRLIVTQNQFV